MPRLRALVSVLTLLLVSVLAFSGPAAAKPAAPVQHALIVASGSSWAANAVEQWISDVQSRGLQVTFTPNGSAAGRQDFANDLDDFAVSDIGYQGTDPVTGQADSSSRPYAYLPIVAGGTSLPYQVKVNGVALTNLRLSGKVVAEIFTNQITNWDDPQIKKDNPGVDLPDLQIIPVVHSEGSGSTYQFTRYLSTEFSSVWSSISNIKGGTEYFPQASSGNTVRESGSDAVMNFLSSGSANGAIGYDEYSYPLAQNFPVAKLLNTGGYYTLPNQYNVAVALTKAQINTNKSSPDYLLQNLNNVYTYNDPRVYPMSSYSYAIIPTSPTDQKETTAKRQTIADYLDYSVCQGQAEMGKVGYSPLPINLVQASFAQVTKLHAADKGVDISQAKVQDCNNPTFEAGNPSANYLAKVAPYPQACDKYGQPNCTDSGNTGQLNPNQGGAKTSKGGTNTGGSNTGGSNTGGSNTGGSNTGGSNTGGSSTGGSNTGGTSTGGSNTGGTNTGGTNTGGTNTGGTNTGGTNTGGTNTGGTNTGTHTDPVSGQQVANTGTSGSGTQVVGEATTLPQSQSLSTDIALGILAGAVLLALLIVPPVVASRLKRNGPR